MAPLPENKSKALFGSGSEKLELSGAEMGLSSSVVMEVGATGLGSSDTGLDPPGTGMGNTGTTKDAAGS